MKCPICGHPESRVMESRPSEQGSSIRRRRECIGCGRRFTTYERAEEIAFHVIKKDGRREPFDRRKILVGLLKACEKRPISLETLEELVDEIEKQVKNRWEREVETGEIGELVMEALKNLDEVAYVRFASVYREFKDLQSFLDEFKALLAKGQRNAAGQEGDERPVGRPIEPSPDTRGLRGLRR